MDVGNLGKFQRILVANKIILIINVMKRKIPRGNVIISLLSSTSKKKPNKTYLIGFLMIHKRETFEQPKILRVQRSLNVWKTGRKADFPASFLSHCFLLLLPPSIRSSALPNCVRCQKFVTNY